MAKKEKGVCSVDGCGGPGYARGWCAKHYERWRRHGDPSVSLPPGSPAGTQDPLYRRCKIEGCDRLGPFIKGLCGAHYGRLKDHGDPLAGKPKTGVVTARSSLEVCACDGCKRVAIAKGFCNAHWERVKAHGDPMPHKPLRVYAKGGGRPLAYANGYMQRWDGEKQKLVLDHRAVMEQFLGRPLRKGETVHHKNGNRSDNRLSNLELWLKSQPAGQRAIDLLDWAREIIETYASEESILKKQRNHGK